MKKTIFSVVAAVAIAAASLTAGWAVAQDDDVPGEAALKETFGDWEKRCADDNRCYIFQQAVNNEGQPVLRVRIVKLGAPIEDGQGGTVVARADIITPLDVFLPNGVGMKIDDGPVQTALFVRCRPIGCVARPPLTDLLVEKMKQGGTANFVMFQDPQAPPVIAPLSLNGFTAAIDSL